MTTLEKLKQELRDWLKEQDNPRGLMLFNTIESKENTLNKELPHGYVDYEHELDEDRKELRGF